MSRSNQEEKIANSREVDENENREDRSGRIPDLTKQQLQTAIDCLKKMWKSRDRKEIIAEDTKEIVRR